ncbi:DUF3311 domain-containing protein [Saccharopolyspora oryzae]|uniref:DUF3311 domain-containing protein n=1 Tax=Saccharopolyspora oryzae TaxID=2997343 RepID=A0ABT4USB5_9PSEU|nr:DUF3311 domain-containing protein [Saccharopolyspora oryzae]MDA3624593.1 DUF3311 domain-containing protein [Saccharopolyspora oryzae]
MGNASGPSQARTARPLRIALSCLLILVPVALALAVPLYQRTSPALIGIPFFYWFQMAMAVLAALGTSTVFRLLFTGDDDGEGRA